MIGINRKKIREKLHLNGIQRIGIFFLINNILIGTNKYSCRIKRKLLSSIGCSIGEATTIVGPIECRGTLIVGKNCWIGKNLKINGNGTVVIGDNCDLGPEITFQTGGHKLGSSHRRAGKGEVFHQIIGNGVWIGGRSTICNNTTIGNGCVIAGCACVTKNVEENTLVGGVPAKVIRRL